MENTKVPLFENFNLTTRVLPYYSYAHNSFLLLSTLCSRSRAKLDEFYWEFRKAMCKYWTKLFYQKDKYPIFPSDLFEISFYCYNEKQANSLIKYLEDIEERKGYYFNSHYMHEQIFINYIILGYQCVKNLIPYVDSLKSIKVTKSFYLTVERRSMQEWSMFDWILLSCPSLKSLNEKLEEFDESNGMDCKTILDVNPFKLINYVSLNYLSYEDISEALNIIKKGDLTLNCWELNNSYPDEFENIIKIFMFKNGVNQFISEFSHIPEIEDETIKALK